MFVTHTERDERAYRALLAYAERVGGDMGDRETLAADLIADLLHHIEEYSGGAVDVLARAVSYYTEESTP